MKCNNLRFFILIICLISTCLTFITRTCMNIALVSMVKGSNETSNNEQTDKIKYSWTESDQGLILSAFYWSYIMFQMPMGSLAEKIGGKYIICICLALSAMVNLVTPLVTEYLILVVLLRFILGAVQAGMFPAAFRLQVNWMPIRNRSLGFACMDAGATIGSIITFFAAGFLIESFDWPCLFYVSGSMSLIVLVIFSLFVKSNPEEHPFVTESELCLIKGKYKYSDEKGEKLNINIDENINDITSRDEKNNLKNIEINIKQEKKQQQNQQHLVPSVIVTPVLNCEIDLKKSIVPLETGEQSNNNNNNNNLQLKSEKKHNQSIGIKGEDEKEKSIDINHHVRSSMDKSFSELPKLLSPNDVGYNGNQSNGGLNLLPVDRRMSLAVSVTGEKVPWARILTNVPVLVTGLFKFAVSWNFMVFYTKMPSFLHEVAGVDITSNGVINAMNNICIAISLMTFGYLSEKIIESGWLTRTECRKFFAIFSGFCQALAIASIPYMAANSNLTFLTILLFATSFCNGCQSGSDIPLPSEMTKAFPATLYALLNIIATSTGIIVPPFVAFILNVFGEDRNFGWSVVFYMSSSLTIVSTIIFMLFSSAERQPFDFASRKISYYGPNYGQNYCDYNECDVTITTCMTNDDFHDIDLKGDKLNKDDHVDVDIEKVTTSSK